MLDHYNRSINYLRVSVTDKCNLRCVYCMPEEGVIPMRHNDILSFEEIVKIIRFGVENGINKVRLTGGEPLVRKGIVSLVEMISKIDGIEDFGMTTNGILLPKYAQDLANAGLHRVNISLDTMDAEKYAQITRLGKLEDVFRGIDSAKKANLKPIKINCVIKNSVEEPDAIAVKEFCENNGLEVRFIYEMDLESGDFHQVVGGEGGNCSKCNRMRLTADGKLKPCLFSDLSFDCRQLGIENAYTTAINKKPANGVANHTGRFHNIGG